jgi:hypothetical protein
MVLHRSGAVIDPLKKALADPDLDVRYQAVSGLRESHRAERVVDLGR